MQTRALHVDECEETIADCNDIFIVIRTIQCQGISCEPQGCPEFGMSEDYKIVSNVVRVTSYHELTLR